MNVVWTLLVGYLLGAIPSAVLVSRIAKQDDIRRYGSGNPGASNVTRTYGIKLGLIVLVCDMLKGYLGALLGAMILPGAGVYYGGLMAIIGHNWPVFLKFKGGKGVATTLGVLLLLMPWITAMAIALFAATLALWRMFSLCSLLTMGFVWLMTLFNYAHDTTLFLFVTFVTVMAFARHSANIDRLLKGKEAKLRL